MTNSSYRWYCTCTPGLALVIMRVRPSDSCMVSNATELRSQPEVMAAGLNAVPTKVSPECSLVTLMYDGQYSRFA